MGLGSLEVELLSTILEYVHKTSAHTTNSISLVNKHLFATARRIRFHHQIIDLTDSGKAQSRLSAYLAELDALRSIRNLTIVGGRRSDLPGEVLRIQRTYETLATLVRNLANLRGVVWCYADPIPLTVLDAIHHYQPRASLQIYNWSRRANDSDHDDPAEQALARSPALKRLQASIWNRSVDAHPDLREAACKRIIATAPNLQYASVTVGRSGSDFHVLSPAEHAELAEKEELFYTHNRPSISLKALTLDGYGLSRQTLDHWGRFLDFSKLESLKCSRGFIPDKSYFELAPELLSGLKNVSLNFAQNNDASIAASAENYLTTCSPLQSISLWSWMDVISLRTILKHGDSLKSLQLHERESIHLDIPRRLLTATDVADIRRACPLLQDFTMDIDREAEDWEEEAENRAIYGELGRFGPRLDKIQLYFNLGVAAEIADQNRQTHRVVSAAEDASSSLGSEAGGDQDGTHAKRSKRHGGLSAREKALLPRLSPGSTSEYVRYIWTTIFGGRRTGERALDIKIGEWERKMDTSYPVDWILWERYNRSYLKLRPHERDDMLDEVVLTCKGGLQGKI